MIPLRLRAEGAPGTEPFVLRLRADGDAELLAAGPFDAFFRESDEGGHVYTTAHGEIRLVGLAATDLAGDVLLVDPARAVAHRLIRARSEHNTLLVTERCDQLCVMCSQPPKEHHTDLFRLFLQAVLLAPPEMTIGITGGEPTLFKAALFEFLRRSLAARPDLSFHVLTNAQHFADEDVGIFRELPAEKVLWGVPLYAASPTLHDQIVGKAGAFSRLQESLAVLARGGAAVELRTVIMTNNAEVLPDLADFVTMQTPFISFWAIMQLENIGYGRKNWNTLFFDNSVHFEPIAEAIDTARARGLEVALYNFPLCTVPVSHRSYAKASISDWKQRYLAKCDGCRLRGDCGGFFEWYPEERGFHAVGWA